MKARVTTKVIIDAPAEQIFRYLTDTHYHKLWNPSMTKVVPLFELTQGATYRTQSHLFGMRLGGKVGVAKLLPNKELELVSITGMVQYRANFRLSKKGAATQVTCAITVGSDSKAFAFARPMMKILAEREVNGDLVALKTAVEQDQQPSK